MKKRTAARSMAAVVGAAMVLTACGGGNNAAATTAAAGGSETQATAESSGGGNITKTDIVFAQPQPTRVVGFDFPQLLFQLVVDSQYSICCRQIHLVGIGHTK